MTPDWIWVGRAPCHYWERAQCLKGGERVNACSPSTSRPRTRSLMPDYIRRPFIPADDALPQRRHRKMLKDGSSEVWPEEAENIFLDGLREYWNSPCANWNKGRSRWRNSFLVEYLRSKGIERSKKQVASHIQVLRNMWKGHKCMLLILFILLNNLSKLFSHPSVH